MSRIKEQFFEEINSRDDNKRIDDEYFYNKYLAEIYAIKNHPISSCCNANIGFAEIKDKHFTVCKRCFNFCYVN